MKFSKEVRTTLFFASSGILAGVVSELFYQYITTTFVGILMLFLSFIILWFFAEISPIVGLETNPEFGKGKTLSSGFFPHLILWLFTWIGLHSFTVANPPYWENGEYWVYETEDGQFAMKMFEWDDENGYPSYKTNITASNENVTIPFFSYLLQVDDKQNYLAEFSRNDLGLLELWYDNDSRDFDILRHVYIPLSHHESWDQKVDVENISDDKIDEFELDAEVVEKVDVDTPYDTFTCQKIEINFSYAPAIVTIYYSDEINNLVKIEGAFGNCTLVGHGKESDSSNFEDKNKDGILDIFVK